MQESDTTGASRDAWMAGDAYEDYMGRWSRPLARRFVEWLHAERSGHWLDVGCGTGALTSTICRLSEPSSVVACDPSEPFIEHARKTLTDGRVTFVAAGVDALPTRPGGFDVIVSGLVLNFLTDTERVLSTFRERLRRGGTIASYVWDYADGMEWLRVFWDEAVASDPRARAFDEGRRFPLCRSGALASAFRAAGLGQVDADALEIPTVFTTFEDYWEPFLRGTGPAPGYVASLDPERRASLRERLRHRLPGGSDGRIQLRARAWTVRGTAG
jgi:trans-aconitate methyltransferase